MTDKSLEEWLFKQVSSIAFCTIYGKTRYAAAHLLEGHIAIIVDTSPSVILVPSTSFHHLQHAEEYRQAPANWNMLFGCIRFSGSFIKFISIPFWYLLG